MRPTTKLTGKRADLSGLHTRYMNPGELDKICELVSLVSATRFLEIGTNTGRTSLAVLRNCPTVRRAWGVDVGNNYKFEKAVQARELPPRPGETALVDSRYRCLLARKGSFDLDASELPTFEAVLVDGDHSARGVLNDRKLAISLGARIIIYHDDNGRDTVDVTRTLDALHAQGAPIVHVEDSWLAFEMRLPA